MTPVLSNSEIADRLASLAQLLSTQKENPHKVRAYRRAAARIRTFSESLDELVSEDFDLTQFPGVGEGIASAIREIVQTGTLGKLDRLRDTATPAIAGLSKHPKLDPKRVLRIYKKLGLASVEELRERMESGQIARTFGERMAQHVRQGLTDNPAMLLYHADGLSDAVSEFLLTRCKVGRAEAAGAFRRRVEVVDELAFVVKTDDFPSVVAHLQRYGGRAPLIASSGELAQVSLPSGMPLSVQLASRAEWGLRMAQSTGSEAHLKKLAALRNASFPDKAFETEESFYRHFGLAYIEPELREGLDEIERAAAGSLPRLVMMPDIKGDLHAHSTSSDGSNSIEEMAEAARARGYSYLGITDHSQSLKIARGVPIAEMWEQIRYIDTLNGRLNGFRVLKSAEVDILLDGSLDYPDDLLKELDYTVCSVHSRFGLDKVQQTERIMRAMDHRYFHILGHATGRLLLQRPGYEVDMERLIAHASASGCFFEINSSPNRLDLSAEYARRASSAGVMIAVNTDSHSTGELALVRCGLDQARRAGLEKSAVLNCQPLQKLEQLLRR